MDKVERKEAKDNGHGIRTIAFTELGELIPNVGRIVGYNDILKGDKVNYQGEEYTVVMVSRLGHFGLSETGKSPYTITVFPDEITVHSDINAKE